jgi:hypothetical protein
MRGSDRGQVLVIVALGLVVLLGAAAFTIDLGRRAAEERYLQNAADAAALAGCRALINGASDSAAKQEADNVARANLTASPSGTDFTLPGVADALVYADGHAGDPSFLDAGILISSASVRVAITSYVPATIGAIVGAPNLKAQGRARCEPQGGPALPIVARRYANPPGPANGFVDYMATTGTSSVGQVDTNQTIDASGLIGYSGTGRTAASEADPGPEFELYGPAAKATNANDFRGFIALDVRNFQDTTSRIYYNKVTAGTNVQTLKNMQGAYLLSGRYPGPMFPAVTSPADPNDQVAVMSGNDSSMVVGNFDRVFDVGDRVLLALYNGTVMEIPDFSISPPAAFVLPANGTTAAGPSFTVSKNDAFTSTVTLRMRGDFGADLAGHPEYNIVPDPAVTPPSAGFMNEPTWSTNVFVPGKNGTRINTSNIQTNAIPAGIYTVWLEGKSGDPYYQTRRVAVPAQIAGAIRDFSLQKSTTTGSVASLGGSLTLPIVVSTDKSSKATSWGSTTSAVSVSWDTDSFTDCSLAAKTIAPGQITFSPSSSMVPTEAGTSTSLTISTVGLNAGCYRFNLRASGTNGDGQPVTHIQPITFTLATSASTGSYVDIIGFAVFKITNIDANSIGGQAVTGAYADPTALGLMRAMQPRLVDW